jgi:ribose transport system substrate-binding protein
MRREVEGLVTGFRRTVRRVGLACAVVGAGIAVAACGSDSASTSTSASKNSSTQSGSTKLIVAAIPFQCGLNDFTKSLCVGLNDVKRRLPAGFTLQQKNTTDFSDVASFTALIRNALQLRPAGLVVFNDGGPAQVPVLKQACAQGVKVIILDNAAEGLGDCESSFIAANNRALGISLGKWLIAHPPASKDIGIVTQQPGQYQSARDRVEGFTSTIKPAGYRVVATGITDLTPGKSRAMATNLLTAHPSIGAMFSAMDQIGGEVAQAARHNEKMTLLSIDGSLDAVRRIVTDANPSANAAQAPYWLATQSVLQIVKLLQGQKIPKVIYEPSKVVDKTNAKQFVDQGGLR